jgi:hypothetical protein
MGTAKVLQKRKKVDWCDLCKREHKYALKDTGPLSYAGMRLKRNAKPPRDAKGHFIKKEIKCHKED